MILFFIALIALVLGYFIYSKFVEKVWGADENKTTPAVKFDDGVDFVKMPLWRIFLVQFLNIAGLGPVFGAVAGAVFGPVALLWIVIGCIFAGGVHDYLVGMASVRYNGKSSVHITQYIFGKYFKYIFLIFYITLLLLLGTVFAINPAKMLANIFHMQLIWWVMIIFGYYFLATLLPVDKIIGRFYPYFAALLVIMTIAVMVKLGFSGREFYPDLTIHNLHPNGVSIFPTLFITIACGAISGFHATQSPIMARCLPNEKDGRMIFYGAMVTEGIVALIWATLAISFYQHSDTLFLALNNLGQGGVVSEISKTLLGNIGGTLTILSVVVLSITSGDTAFRSIRLTISETFGINQKDKLKRLVMSAIIIGMAVMLYKFDLLALWQYFGLSNQILSSLSLWTLTYYLSEKQRFYWISLIPAIFMTTVVISYVLQDKICFNLPETASNIASVICMLVLVVGFFVFNHKVKFRKQRVHSVDIDKANTHS